MNRFDFQNNYNLVNFIFQTLATGETPEENPLDTNLFKEIEHILKDDEFTVSDRVRTLLACMLAFKAIDGKAIGESIFGMGMMDTFKGLSILNFRANIATDKKDPRVNITQI